MLTWNNIEGEENAFEASDKGFDFHLRLEGGRWFLDVFDNSIENADNAYILSSDFTTATEAKTEAESFLN